MLPWILLPVPLAIAFANFSEPLAGVSLSYPVLTTSAVVPIVLVVVYWGYGLLVSWWFRRTGRDVDDVTGQEWRRRKLRWWDRGGA